MTGDEREITVKIRGMAAERGIEVQIAYDGSKVSESSRRAQSDAPYLCRQTADQFTQEAARLPLDCLTNNSLPLPAVAR